MLQKESITLNSDTSTFKKLKIFHIYKQGVGKQGRLGFFTFNSIQKYAYFTKPTTSRRKRKRKTRGCIIRTKKNLVGHDHQTIKSNANFSTTFIPSAYRSTIYIKGPILYNMKRAKYIMRASRTI